MVARPAPPRSGVMRNMPAQVKTNDNAPVQFLLYLLAGTGVSGTSGAPSNKTQCTP